MAVLVTEAGADKLVDELQEVQEMIIRKLPTPFLHIPYIAGAAISGTGTVILVLNVTDLVRAATRYS